jgi:hypothetical protein
VAIETKDCESGKPSSSRRHLLTGFVRDATPEQIHAWRASLKPLRQQCDLVLDERAGAQRYCAILEYRMPDGSRRVDAELRLASGVLVVEMKGDGNWQPEYREQVADYARRLYWCNRYCGEASTRMHPLLVNYGFGSEPKVRG